MDRIEGKVEEGEIEEGEIDEAEEGETEEANATSMDEKDPGVDVANASAFEKAKASGDKSKMDFLLFGDSD